MCDFRVCRRHRAELHAAGRCPPGYWQHAIVSIQSTVEVHEQQERVEREHRFPSILVVFLLTRLDDVILYRGVGRIGRELPGFQFRSHVKHVSDDAHVPLVRRTVRQ